MLLLFFNMKICCCLWLFVHVLHMESCRQSLVKLLNEVSVKRNALHLTVWAFFCNSKLHVAIIPFCLITQFTLVKSLPVNMLVLLLC